MGPKPCSLYSFTDGNYIREKPSRKEVLARNVPFMLCSIKHSKITDWYLQNDVLHIPIHSGCCNADLICISDWHDWANLTKPVLPFGSTQHTDLEKPGRQNCIHGSAGLHFHQRQCFDDALNFLIKFSLYSSFPLCTRLIAESGLVAPHPCHIWDNADWLWQWWHVLSCCCVPPVKILHRSQAWQLNWYCDSSP